MSDSPRPQGTPYLDRRRLLGCAALFGISGPLLVACGSDDSGSSSAGGSSDSPSESGSPSASGDAPSGGAGLVEAADVPVGGGVVLTGQKIVVTQPAKGEFKAFSAVCTHQGTILSSVEGGKITCPAHGSQFSAEDGANVTGPNGSPGGSVAALAEIPVTVTDGQVVEA